MFCKYCGKDVADDSIYCKYCGQNLSDDACDSKYNTLKEWNGFSDEDENEDEDVVTYDSYSQKNNNSSNSSLKQIVTELYKSPKWLKVFLIFLLIVTISSINRSCKTIKGDINASRTDTSRVINQSVEIPTFTPEPTPQKSHDEIMAEYNQSKENAKQSLHELKESVIDSFKKAWNAPAE